MSELHTPEQNKIIEQYKNSIDLDVKEYIKEVLAGKEENKFITVAFLTEKMAMEIEKLTGKSVYGHRVVLDANSIIHIVNRHGEKGKHDSCMSNIDDIARIGYVLLNYDNIEYDGICTYGYLDEEGKPSPLIKISKRIDGTYYIIEAVNSSKRKKSFIISAYISKA